MCVCVIIHVSERLHVYVYNSVLIGTQIQSLVLYCRLVLIIIFRGEPERAPNTRGTGSGFICIYTCMYVCGVIISVRRELNFERVR